MVNLIFIGPIHLCLQYHAGPTGSDIELQDTTSLHVHS